MNRLLIPTLCLASCVTLTACDPAFVRSIEVAGPGSASMALFPLSEVDELAETLEFVRMKPPQGNRETLESQGYELVAYYERTEPEFSTLESLSISRSAGGQSYRIDLFAFVALGQPERLGDFREALTSLLCEKGYVVEGAEGCGE